MLIIKYLSDDLNSNCKSQVPLSIETSLDNTSLYGRSPDGWFVKGGVEKSYTCATMKSDVVLGNRSLFAKLNFMSTQAGIRDGQHGVYEVRLIQNIWNEKEWLPIRVRVDNGKFYIYDLFSNIIAGNNDAPVFIQTPNIVYTISVLMFQKGILARLSGDGVPGGFIDISAEDGKRYIPGYPGFGLEGNPHSTSGEAVVKDWFIATVGPYRTGICAIGDSITAGLQEKPEKEDYVHIVTEHLGQRFTFNNGSGGTSTLMDLERFPVEIAPFEPRIIWIEGGTNDINQNCSAQNIFKNLLSQIKLITWGGVPILSTVPPSKCFDHNKNIQLTALNDLIRNSGHLYIDRNALVRDIENPYQMNPVFDLGDGIHINTDGNALIAKEALRVINKNLGHRIKDQCEGEGEGEDDMNINKCSNERLPMKDIFELLEHD